MKKIINQSSVSLNYPLSNCLLLITDGISLPGKSVPYRVEKVFNNEVFYAVKKLLRMNGIQSQMKHCVLTLNQSSHQLKETAMKSTAHLNMSQDSGLR